MLIQALCEYERSHPTEGSPNYYTARPVRWKAVLTPGGKFVRWVKLFTDEVEPPKLPVPTTKRGNAPLALLLADNAEYTLGVGDPDRKDRIALYHAEYRNQLTVAQNAGLHAAKLVLTAIDGLKPPKGMAGGHTIVFEVDSVLLTNTSEVQRYWAGLQDARVSDGPVQACGCCGERRPIVRLVTDWLKKVPDSLQGACALVSANTDATWRYGRQKALGAGLCYPCVRDAVRALNRMIVDPGLATTIGNLVVVVWGDDAPVLEALTAPGVGMVPTLRAAHAGGRVHVLCLAARKSRAVVRDFRTHDTHVLCDRLADWIETQPAPAPLAEQWRKNAKGKKIRVPGLVNAIHAGGNLRRVPAQAAADFVLAATAGTPLPATVRAAAENRMLKADDADPIAENLKALCARYHPEGLMTETNPADTMAYRCGELLAVLERVQKAAVPGINRTVADRCLRTVGTSPQAVLGSALTDAKAHLSKLTRGGKSSRHADALVEAQQGLVIPERFTGGDQANFCMGYYAKAATFSTRPDAKKADKPGEAAKA